MSSPQKGRRRVGHSGGANLKGDNNMLFLIKNTEIHEVIPVQVNVSHIKYLEGILTDYNDLLDQENSTRPIEFRREDEDTWHS